jgi:hypothetical protein
LHEQMGEDKAYVGGTSMAWGDIDEPGGRVSPYIEEDPYREQDS